jgi:hypothetical protein
MTTGTLALLFFGAWLALALLQPTSAAD